MGAWIEFVVDLGVGMCEFVLGRNEDPHRVRRGDFADAVEPLDVGAKGVVECKGRRLAARNVGSVPIEKHAPCRIVRARGEDFCVSGDKER